MMKRNTNKDAETAKIVKIACWSAIGVLFVWALTFFLFFISKSDERGQFGDMFGAVNALFSGLAFAGLIITLILQRRELELQRQELALTRKEMEDQTTEFEKQNETLKIQRFENTFFNMLSQFQEVVNSLSVRYMKFNTTYELIGRDTFKATFKEVTVLVDIPKDNQSHRSYRGMADTIKAVGLNGYCKSDIPTYFDHYFRLLYRILKFVKDTPLITEFDDEYEYTSMLRAVLSRYELVWLYYNGLSDYGVEKLKPLIERYAMLKSLRDDLLVDGVDVGSYAESAYRKTRPDEGLVTQQ